MDLLKLLTRDLLLKGSTLHHSDFFNSLLIVFFIDTVCNYVSKGESFHTGHPQKEINFNLPVTKGRLVLP